MNDIYQRLNDLKTEINTFYGNIESITHSLEIVSYVRNHPDAGKEELEIAMEFGKFLIQIAESYPIEKYSSKSKERFFRLIEEMKEEVEAISKMEPMNQAYTDLNGWVESLSICKFEFGNVISEKYITSDQVYVDLRSAILGKNEMKHELYTGKIVEKLESGRKSLSSSCKIEVEDYELSQLIKMIRNHPRFNYRLMHFSNNAKKVNEQLEWEMTVNHVKLFEKRLKRLSIDRYNNNNAIL